MVPPMDRGGSNNVTRLRSGDAVVPQRTPPVNYDAEQALLGAILANNLVFDRVNEFLRPEHFADPLRYDPYRWLRRHERDAQDGAHDVRAYLQFGAGPRVCIGASFAMQEAIIALAVLLSRFRFDTVEETNPWPVQKLTTQPQGGLPMRVSRR